MYQKNNMGIIVAYMLGLHNFYKGENVVAIEVVEGQDDGMPNEFLVGSR